MAKAPKKTISSLAKRLRDAIAVKYYDWYGMDVNPETEVTVTCGATEAMVSVMLAVVDPGEEVIVFEPFYEIGRAHV